MEMIPYSGLKISPAGNTEGYDEQKDLIERGAKRLQSAYVLNGNGKRIVRSVPTEEKGKFFTVFINPDGFNFGLYKDGAITQDMDFGHPPITKRHLDRLYDRAENDMNGLLNYSDDPKIERAWNIHLEMKGIDEFADAIRSMETEKLAL